MARPKHGPDWRGIRLLSEDMGGARSPEFADFRYDGQQYVTLTEYLVAEMLTEQGIPFTPNVKILLGLRDTALRLRRDQPVVYVPDFIFDKAEFIWTWPNGRTEIVHGIECKGRTRRSGHKHSRLVKVRWLLDERGINLIVLSEEETLEFQQLGGLPLSRILT